MARRMIHALITLGALVAASAACAQDVANYPNKPVRIIVPFAPGGAVDIIARTVGAELTRSWSQGVVVVNEAGASGTLGLTQGAKALPDGYTLTMASSTTLINQYVLANAPYDLFRDFAMITQTSDQPFGLVVHPSLPAKNVKELIAYARANPGKINYSSSGTGGASHLAGALFAQMAGLNLVHVAYKGGGPAMIDLVGGVIQMQFSTILQASAALKANKLRLIAVTSKTRVATDPDVPTMIEAGVPGYEVITWQGIMAPLKTPQPIVAKLNRDIVAIVNSPGISAKIQADGSRVVGGTPEQFTAMLKTDAALWSKLIKDIGLEPQ